MLTHQNCRRPSPRHRTPPYPLLMRYLGVRRISYLDSRHVQGSVPLTFMPRSICLDSVVLVSLFTTSGRQVSDPNPQVSRPTVRRILSRNQKYQNTPIPFFYLRSVPTLRKNVTGPVCECRGTVGRFKGPTESRQPRRKEVSSLLSRRFDGVSNDRPSMDHFCVRRSVLRNQGPGHNGD